MKKDERDALETLFQEGLTDVVVQPDDQLWPRILKGLGDKNRKRLLWWIIPVGIVLIAGAVWYTQTIENNTPEKTEIASEARENKPAPVVAEKEIAPTSPAHVTGEKETNSVYSQEEITAVPSAIASSQKDIYPIPFQEKMMTKKETTSIPSQEESIPAMPPFAKITKEETTLTPPLTPEITSDSTKASLVSSPADSVAPEIDSVPEIATAPTKPLTNTTTTAPPKPARKPLGISLVLNPFLQFAQVQGNHQAADYRRKHDKQGQGISLGIKAEKQLTNSWSVYIGVERTTYTQDVAKEKKDLHTVFRDSVKAMRKASLEIIYFKRYTTDTTSQLTYVQNNYQYLTIPIGLTYQFKISEKFGGRVNAGIAYSMLTGASVNTNYDVLGGPVKDQSAVHKNLVLLQASVGIVYKPGQRFSYHITPNVSYTNSSVIKNLPFTEKHILTGISFGTTFWLGK